MSLYRESSSADFTAAGVVLCMVMQVSDLWVSYHALDGGRSSVQLSLPHVLGVDARPGVLPEHSLVISAGAPPPFVPPSTRCNQHANRSVVLKIIVVLSQKLAVLVIKGLMS